MSAQLNRNIYSDMLLDVAMNTKLNLDVPKGAAQSAFQKLLDQLESPAPIKDEATYAQYRILSTTLCSWSCTTSNRNLPENDQVWSLETQYNRRLHAWMKKTRLIQDPLTKTVAKLLSWNKMFARFTTTAHWVKLADYALANNVLFRDENGSLVVAGFNYKVGDNVFTPDRRGRDHRNYVKTCAPQAFLLGYTPKKMLADAGWATDKIIPELPEEYRVTYMGDGKGCAKNHRVTKQEQQLAKQFFAGMK